MNTLLQLAGVFALLSVVAVGGGSTILPEMKRLTVDQYHWLTDQQFKDVYSLGQVAPGPGMLYVSVIGYRAAGIPGALVATAAMFLPACVLTYFAGLVWDRFGESRWLKPVKAGLAPVTVGLMLAGTVSVGKIAIMDWVTALIGLVVTVMLLRTRVSPTLLVLTSGAIGWLFLR
jgi:chromate transporter